MTTPFYFWNRIDDLLGKRTVKSLAEESGLNYRTIKNQRTLDRFPGIEECYKLATALNTTVEYLLTGDKQLAGCPEAEAVKLDPNLQALVRAVQRDPRLLEIIGSVVASSEEHLKEA